MSRPAHYNDPILGPEARAFDARITERIAAGFVPDLRHAVRCNFFYKSFWRDPLFIDLYEGEVVRSYLSLIEEHCGRNQRILDVGCGAGYVTLELARAGHRVVGVDISAECIAAAERQRDASPRTAEFGSLDYIAGPIEQVDGIFDLVLFSVSLHHFPDLNLALTEACRRLRSGGFLLCCEPCHETWRKTDAAQVALIRAMLSAVGLWYDPDEAAAPRSAQDFDTLAEAVLVEYCEERDPHETEGQSPNDLQNDGSALLAALRRRFDEIAFLPGASFIYRVLGGIRADPETTERTARLLAAYDRYAVDNEIIRPNFFYFLGRLET